MPKVTDRQGKPSSGQMPGIVEALVVDNVDPEKMGRVKLKFPSLPDMPESFWARLVVPMAGNKMGWMTIPEINDEVVVSFVHGDINYAMVLGAVYNGSDLPPYANEDGDNNLRVFQSRSGHRVTFDDTSGSERIEIISHNKEVRVVIDSSGKSVSVYAGKDFIVEAVGTLSLKCKDFVTEASSSITMKAGSTMKLESGASTTIDGGGTLTLKAGMVQIN